MNNCEIKTPPVFSQEIPKWDRNTYADGNAMGAVVEQLFNNTVYNKEELKEKVDTEGGDISETQVSVIDESTETFPVPMSGDKAKGLWGKLKKWQQDCLAKFGNYVLTSMITNQHVNSTSNIPSSALVYLMQKGITQLNSDLGTWKVQAPRSGICNLNTNAWLTADSTVTWIVVNGICHLHYVLTVKAASAGAELATGMPAPAQFVHHVANEWVLTGQTGSGKACKLMIDGSRMSGDIWTGTYAGTICYAVA